MQIRKSGAVTALVGFGFFASHDAVIKALGATYSTFQIAFFSVLFGMPLVMLMLVRDAKPGTLRPRHPGWVATRAGLGVITGFSAFYAFTHLPLTEVYAILFAQPLLITALSVPFLGEKVGLRRWIAVFTGLVGVLIVLQPATTELSIGHLAALTSAICGSFVSIILRKIGAQERSAVMILYPMMANLVVMGTLMPFVYIPMPIGDLGLAAFLAVLGFCGMLGLLLAYQRAAVSVVAPMQYSQIIWAVLFGLIFFDEMPALATAIGTAVIIASGLYIVMREEGGGTTTERPVTAGRTPRGDTALGMRTGDIMRLFGLREGPLRSDKE